MLKTFTVTQEQIDAARDDLNISAEHRDLVCPVARCLHENGYPHARVGCYGIRLYGKGYDPISMPHTLVRAVCKFDLDDQMEPITFTLDIPED